MKSHFFVNDMSHLTNVFSKQSLCGLLKIADEN